MVRLTLRHPLRLLLTVILAAAGLPGEDCVIVNPGVALEAISGEGLKDIFLGRKTTWPDGSLVAVIIPKNGPSHDDLLGRLDKSPEQFLIGWKKLVFTGRGFMPDMIANEGRWWPWWRGPRGRSASPTGPRSPLASRS